jgi:2-oxoisovalerate dehydrogenase E1 component
MKEAIASRKDRCGCSDDQRLLVWHQIWKSLPRLPSEKIAGLMFSSRKRESYDPDRKPELLLSHDENPRVQALAKKSRAGVIDGKPVSKNKVFQYRDAIFEAALHRFETDPTMVAYGEENRDWGGAFACYRGLTESLPYHRLFNSPISEAAIVGTACGYALEGGRALVELMYCDFMGRAGDEIFNQLAKWQSMSACILEMPVTLRVSVGSKYGAQHSQDWCALVNHIPGLKVVFPSTPYDAKGMLNTALAGSDPVIFFESQRLYDIGELFEKEVPAEYYEVPFGPPAQRRVGKGYYSDHRWCHHVPCFGSGRYFRTESTGSPVMCLIAVPSVHWIMIR